MITIALGIIFLIVTLALATEGKSGMVPTLCAAGITVSLFGLWPVGVVLVIASVVYHLCEGINLG